MTDAIHDLMINPELGLAITAAQQAIITQRTPPNVVRERVGRGGRKLSYVDHVWVTETLNKAFGWNWDFEVLDKGIYEAGGKPFEAWCLARLTVRTPNGTIVKTQFGCQPIEMLRDSDIPVSLGDALKGSGSDALKKCASLLGLGLDLYDSDGDLSRQRQEDAVVSARAELVRAAADLGYTNEREIGAVLQAAGVSPYTASKKAQAIAALREAKERERAAS